MQHIVEKDEGIETFRTATMMLGGWSTRQMGCRSLRF
jgi:hypothetical protein